jgi:hypothetical protein
MDNPTSENSNRATRFVLTYQTPKVARGLANIVAASETEARNQFQQDHPNANIRTIRALDV